MNAIEQTRQRSKAKDYFVCTVCGYATSQMDFSKCPSCFTSTRESASNRAVERASRLFSLRSSYA
jgi:rubrerythrin